MNSAANRQIVAFGGGCIAGYPPSPNLTQFLLSRADKPRPKICFVPTASGDPPAYIDGFYNTLRPMNCERAHLSLINLPTSDLSGFMLAQDIIYVGGGNTRSMLALWREWSLDSILKTAWENGVVLSGTSAGAMCWFEDGLVDSFPGELSPQQSLGFLKGSFCPHYQDNFSQTSNNAAIQNNVISAGYGVEDNVALYYRNTDLIEAVAEMDGPQAYRIEHGATGLVKNPLTVRVLTEPPTTRPV